MNYTIDELLKGRSEIAQFYQRGSQLWDDHAKTLNPERRKTIEGLVDVITKSQPDFEHQCGGRNLGQEIMVTTAFWKCYSLAAGLDRPKAIQLLKAFQQSCCSIEVKAIAQKLGDFHGISLSDTLEK